MAQLLLELFSEEIPAKMQLVASQQLQKSAKAALQEKGIECEEIKSFVTPNRLVLLINGLPESIKASTEEKRGPRVDAPQKAIDGFLKSTGLKQDQLEQRKTDKGEFYFAVSKHKAQPIGKVLTDSLSHILANFSWSKSMKWGRHDVRWVRPLHSILCILDCKVLPVHYGHIKASNVTRGHRFMSPEHFEVTSFAEYEKKLKEADVVIDPEKRKSIIEASFTRLCKTEKISVKPDPSLLEEVVGLVEYPHVLLGNIDKRFMSLPEEVLEGVMRSHQKYFVTLNDKGSFAPYFLTVSNIKPKGSSKNIIHGNERVLRARLADAQFFFEQDRKIPLEKRVPDLSKVLFHNKLGTVKDKTKRITALAKFFALWVPKANLLRVERAGMLAKVDLTTDMVGELPELQGLMGYYYAKDAKEHDDVADALKEHYKPVGASDSCPTKPVSVAVALADKIDTLIGLFIIGDKPTGSKDPFALRRAALGVIRIILENEMRAPMRIAFDKAATLYPAKAYPIEDNNKKGKRKPLFSRRGRKVLNKKALVVEELLDFIVDRLRVILKERGVGHDRISAVFENSEDDDLWSISKRAEALEKLLQTEDGQNLLFAYRRVANMVAAEEKKSKESFEGSVKEKLLSDGAERKLYQAFKQTSTKIDKFLKKDMFEEAMKEFAHLRQPIDRFFDEVVVNADDPMIRKNRLRLLNYMRVTVNRIADLSFIEG